MKASIEDLREAAEGVAETEEAVSEGMGMGGSGTAAAETGKKAMQEFVEYEQARQEVLDTVGANQGPGIGEALSELVGLLKDNPAAIQYLTGTPGEAQSDNQQAVQQRQTQMEPKKTDGGQAEGGIDPDDVYNLAVGQIERVSNLKPNMTLSDAGEWLRDNEGTAKAQIADALEELQ